METNEKPDVIPSRTKPRRFNLLAVVALLALAFTLGMITMRHLHRRDTLTIKFRAASMDTQPLVEAVAFASEHSGDMANHAVTKNYLVDKGLYTINGVCISPLIMNPPQFALSFINPFDKDRITVTVELCAEAGYWRVILPTEAINLLNETDGWNRAFEALKGYADKIKQIKTVLRINQEAIKMGEVIIYNANHACHSQREPTPKDAVLYRGGDGMILTLKGQKIAIVFSPKETMPVKTSPEIAALKCPQANIVLLEASGPRPIFRPDQVIGDTDKDILAACDVFFSEWVKGHDTGIHSPNIKPPPGTP